MPKEKESDISIWLLVLFVLGSIAAVYVVHEGVRIYDRDFRRWPDDDSPMIREMKEQEKNANRPRERS